jgi:nitrogen fixation protein
VKFTITEEIAHPRERVFRTQRDRLVELVPYIPNVENVVVEETEVTGSVVRFLNRWTVASTDIPSTIKGFLKPEHLTYLDRAKWDESSWRCEWELIITALPDAVTARGITSFADEGDETIVRLDGEFLIHPDRVPGVPAFLARTLAPSLERWVVGLLQPNLKKTAAAVGQFIDDHP